jgi:hypothetical protein
MKKVVLICAALLTAACNSDVVKPTQQPANSGEKATQTGSIGALAGTACTRVGECGPGLDCDLTKGPNQGVCVVRADPQSTPPQPPAK